MDPSVVGRWEQTPVVLPILEQLDVIDEPATRPAGMSKVAPGDLKAEVREYVIGPDDLLTVSVYELITLNVEAVQTRRVDELGRIRLPIIGTLKCEGKTATQLEVEIAATLTKRGVLKDPIVSVIVQEKRQNTFSIIGAPREGSTAFGTYTIIGSDFRLLDAIALARGVDSTIETIYVIRQVPLTEEQDKRPPPADGADAQEPGADQNAADLIESIRRAIEEGDGDGAGDDTPGINDGAAPEDIREGVNAARRRPPFVYVGGKWVPTTEGARRIKQRGDAELAQVVTQRVIEIPYDRLIEGDTAYNIVIRPGDIIRIPPLIRGNVYIGGEISRPGTYSLPAERLTLKQLVIAAGGLSPIGVPERVDLIRRVGSNHEATVRVDLKAIFRGSAPDFFLKPNDTVNIGTNFWATPLAVVRNGFRATYGFGFVMDRNFGPDVFP